LLITDQFDYIYKTITDEYSQSKQTILSISELREELNNKLLNLERKKEIKDEKRKIFQMKKENIPLIKKKIEEEIDKITKEKRINDISSDVEIIK
jgi:hypothetical protein